ncbi:MAG: BREX-3 system P-loop-containing protein BrxF [Methylococcaceae bacterium]
MIENLERLVDEIGAVQSKLILLIGAPRSGKTAVLCALAKSRHITPLNVGAALGSRLAAIPHKQRHLEASTLLRELTDKYANDDLLLIDNIELLFDRTLQLDPLDLLRRHAHARRVIAVWPGELRNGRLTYADIGHPEHQDYSLDGVVPFEIQ